MPAPTQVGSTLNGVDVGGGIALSLVQLADNRYVQPAVGSFMNSAGTGITYVQPDTGLPIDIVSIASGVTFTTLPLPTDAATETKQDVLIGHVDGLESSMGDAVTALQIMDDWDETNRCKVNLIVGQAGIAAGAGAVGATTPRVTLANDDPAVVALQAIDDWDETNRCKVNPIAGQAGVAGGSGTVGATTQRVVLATDVAVPMPDAIQGPGDPVVDSYTTASISASANTANQSLVSAPGANKQIWVYGFQGTADTGDGSIAFQDEDDTAASGVMEVAQRGGFGVPPSGNFAQPLWKLATNKALEIDTVTCGFKGSLQYGIIDVS